MSDDTNKKLTRGSTFYANDVYEEMKPFLTERTINAFKARVRNCIGMDQITGKITYVTRFFGVQVNIKEVGIKKLAKVLNELSDKYDIYGTMVPAIAMNTATGKIMILSYIAFKPDDALKIENEDPEFHFKEGHEPKTYLETPEDLEKL